MEKNLKQRNPRGDYSTHLSSPSASPAGLVLSMIHFRGFCGFQSYAYN